MGDPQLAVRGALVAGTNGKGSVIALAGSALRAAGLPGGRDAQAAPRDLPRADRRRRAADRRRDFARLVGGGAPAGRPASRRRLGPPTEFELLTAVMFRHFADARPRRRAGRGGARRPARRDARLGRRRGGRHQRRPRPHRPPRDRRSTAIAREKAAIVERGDVAVTGRDRRGARGRPAAVRAARRAAHGRRAGAGPRLDRDALAGRAAAASGRRPSACAAGTRRRTSPSPTRCWTRSRRRASRASRPTPGGAATRRATLAGPPGAGRRPPAPGRHAGGAARRRAQPRRRGRPRPGARRTCGRTSPAARRRRRAPLDARLGVDGRQGRGGRPRRDRRLPGRSPGPRSCAPRWTCRGRCPPTTSRPPGARPCPVAGCSTAPDPDAALDLALATGRRPGRRGGLAVPRRRGAGAARRRSRAARPGGG